MFPERAVLRVAIGDASWITEYEESTYDFWVGLDAAYGLEMSSLADHAVAKYKGNHFRSIQILIILRMTINGCLTCLCFRPVNMFLELLFT